MTGSGSTGLQCLSEAGHFIENVAGTAGMSLSGLTSSIIPCDRCEVVGLLPSAHYESSIAHGGSRISVPSSMPDSTPVE